jgi:hypothetical protein
MVRYKSRKYQMSEGVLNMLLSTKLANKLKALSGDLDIQLKNIRINGEARGCSGFVTCKLTGNIVYVNTEKSCYSPLAHKNLYRSAKNTKDYTGGINQIATDEDIAESIIKWLKRGYI